MEDANAPPPQPGTREFPPASRRERALWLLGHRRRFRVEGTSMEPTLLDGEDVLVDIQAYIEQGPETGDVVVARHPFKSSVRMVKRVAALKGDTRVLLRGDNPAGSTDERTLGSTAARDIVGKVTARI